MVRKLTLLLILSLSIAGCHRQKLEEILYVKALIPVLIDWEPRALLYVDDDPDENLYSASVWLFPRGESEYQGDPLEYRLDNAEYGYIEVPVGVYDVLVFNKTVGEYSSNVGFRGMDKFETFEYYTKPFVNSKSDNVYDDGREQRLEPDMLAAWRSASDEPLVVTPEMIRQMSDIIICRDYLDKKYKYPLEDEILDPEVELSDKVVPSDFDVLSEDMRQLIDLRPERLTHITPIKVGVKNLFSAKVAIGALCGMSSSVKLAGAEYSTTQTFYKFLYTSKDITSEDNRDGFMEAEFRVIGPLDIAETAEYQLRNRFELYSEYEGSTSYPAAQDEFISSDVAPQVYYGQDHMDLEKIIPIYVDYSAGITIPKVEFGGGGFEVNPNDWDDEIAVPIEVN